MTITITGEMLKTWTEADLLRAAVSLYQVNHRNIKGIEGLACAADLKKGLMVKALDGNAHIGAEAWLKIERELGAKVYQEFVAIKAGKK